MKASYKSACYTNEFEVL